MRGAGLALAPPVQRALFVAEADPPDHAVAAARDLIKCATWYCHRTFTRENDLERHYVATPHHRPAGPPPAKKIQKRKSYTWGDKRDTVREYDKLVAAGVAAPLTEIANTARTKGACADKSTIVRWLAPEMRSQILTLAHKFGYNKLRRRRPPTSGKFKFMEVRLYTRFLFRRQFQRLPVHRKWVRANALNIMAISNPDKADPEAVAAFKASGGWVSRFCRRWEISSQCRTNSHVMSISERLGDIRKFHRFLLYDMQARLPQRCPKYGRFPPTHVFHFDQSPLPFVTTSSKTLNEVGKQCSMGEPGGSGGVKRFCTLQICICASGPHQVVKLEIYFRGKGVGITGKRGDEARARGRARRRG